MAFPVLLAVACIGFACLILLPICRVLYNISPFHPLAAYPGPLTWRATRLPWVMALQRGQLHQELKHIHNTYGPTVRVAPNELSYTQPEAWRDIYVANPRLNEPSSAQLFRRNSVWFKPARPSDAQSIMGPNEANHARCRRAFMPAFTDRALASQHPVIESNVDGFISQLRRLSQSNTALDLVAWINYLTFDVSGLLSFGSTFQSIANGAAHPWVQININFGKGVAMMASLNLLGLSNGPFGKLLKYIIPHKVRERMIYHRELTKEKVHAKLDTFPEGPRADFLDAVIRNNEQARESGKAVGQALSTAEIEINMSILIFAGSETVSSALSAILTLLLQHKDIMELLVQELRSNFNAEAEITADATHDLPYLTAVISEGMRLYPPVPYGVPRIAPKGGASVCGRFVPGGVSVSEALPMRYPPIFCFPYNHTSLKSYPTYPSQHRPINTSQTMLALNQLPAYHSSLNFSSPLNFDPTRFLPQAPSTSTSTSTDAPTHPIFQPFSVGRHQCIGYKFAWAEMRLVLARLLWAFELVPCLPPSDSSPSASAPTSRTTTAASESTTPTTKATETTSIEERVKVRDFGAQKTYLVWEKEPLWVRLRERGNA
jgi:cytochrome P450